MSCPKKLILRIGLRSVYIFFYINIFQGADGLPQPATNNNNLISVAKQTGKQSTEPSDAVQDDPRKIHKRNFGRWRNVNWMLGKRNLGRWKNRRWLAWQQQFDGSPDLLSDLHSLSKRFSDSDIGDVIPMPYPMYDDIMPYMGDLQLQDNDIDGLDKRHASRWNYIHRKLAELAEADKKETDKRVDSRWRLIQNKLNTLNKSEDKRFAGRWRNQNWLLRQFDNDDTKDEKRNFGRWKNRNWVLKQFS